MGMRPDLGNNADIKVTIPVAAARDNETLNGTAIQTTEYSGRGKATLFSAAGVGTAPTMDCKLQESEDGSSWSDIAGATFTQVTDGGDAEESIAFDVQAAAKFIRGVAVIAGAGGNGFVFGMHFTLPPRPDAPSPS